MPSAQQLAAAALLATGALAIDNGVSRTPPMCAPGPPAPLPTPTAAQRRPAESQRGSSAAGLG